jgi:nucleoside-diphosphate-sugar epimerase
MSPSSAAAARVPADGDALIGLDDLVLVTGAAGFIGRHLVKALLERGFRNIRCFVRPSSNTGPLDTILAPWGTVARVQILAGNLLSPDDCAAAAKGATLILHLAAGRGAKSFPDAFMNSVVTTRNLLEAAHEAAVLRRFVNISSFAVYTNRGKPRRRLLDESCPTEERPELRADAYCFAKVKQDELVQLYATRHGIPYVIVRPGYVYGDGNEAITNRVGIGTFGVFLHLGGPNRIPFTFVENCAEAIVLAGITRSVDGQVFNIVDDDLPTSRAFLRLYKRHVRGFRSVYLPHLVSYALSWMWERYSDWSAGQLPAVYNRRNWHAYWKKTSYSNAKAKALLNWAPRVSTADGLRRYFASCRRRCAGA